MSLVTYVERARRKKINMKERARLLALMGKKPTQEDKKEDETSDSDSDPEEQTVKNADADSQSDESDDSSDSDDDNIGGTDQLQSSHKLDIPIVRDIPILS